MYDVLANFPNAGRRRNELGSDLRAYPVHPYIVFYRVDARHETIRIERVIHGRMDIDETDFARP
jgi:toxin ParE1/3/4